jgi:putative transposase
VIQHQLKLKLTARQERELNRWLWHLAAVWNWTIRKIENDARGGIRLGRYEFQNLLAGHGAKVGIPSHVLRAVALNGFNAWQRCFQRSGGRPHFKGRRNKLNSIPFPDPLRFWPNNRVSILGVGRVRYHKQEIPEGKIKCGGFALISVSAPKIRMTDREHKP